MLVFDIETDGLLDKLTRVHCICLQQPDGTVIKYGPSAVDSALVELEAAEMIVGHNSIGFDIPALKKLYPSFKPPVVLDTLVMSRLFWPELRQDDFAFAGTHENFPKQFIGSHALAAWGHRLEVLKGDFGKTTDWSAFTEDMLEYCAQDVRVTSVLFEKQLEKGRVFSQRSITLEHSFAEALEAQMRAGVYFDRASAEELARKLCVRKAHLEDELREACPDFEVKYVTPKKQLERTKTIEFNPTSRDHIAKFFCDKYGWKPKQFTASGRPKVDETVLGKLKFQEASKFAELFLLQKRLGMLAEGPNSWLRKVKADSRIYGRIIHNGAVTSRCTHSSPNLGQVPSSRALYGKECRELFKPSPGMVLVGCDASGLELRCLAHYMAAYDNGDYTKKILEGDIHEFNRRAGGLEKRAQAKVGIYALIYGAKDKTLGKALGGGVREGARFRSEMFKSLPALQGLIENVTQAAKDYGYLKAIDGRRLPVRSPHSALNLLVQSCGAIAMKAAVIQIYRHIKGLHGQARQVLFVHDEVQIETIPKYVEGIKEILEFSIAAAGKKLGMRCPLAGEATTGTSWEETH